MGFFDHRSADRILSNTQIPGITVEKGDHVEFKEEYLDKCREYVTELLTKEMGEKLKKDGVPAGELIIMATLNGEERFHSLRILFQNLHDQKLRFSVVKKDEDISVLIEDTHRRSFFALPNKHRIGVVKSEKVYKCIPDKILRYVPHFGYSGKEVPMGMEYNVSTNRLNIYTGIVGKSMSEYKLTIVDVGVGVSEYEMKAAIKAVTRNG